ncbi:MAG TPA: hypothetical protein VGM74_12060 [Burkholderiaceae bacterium]
MSRASDWLRREFSETRPMHVGATHPEPANEPPAWTLPGELAELLKRRAATPAPRRREARDPSAPERRRQSRPAPLGGIEPQPSAPVPLAPPTFPPGAFDTAAQRPAPADGSALTDRALRRALAVCLMLIVLVAGAWWLLDNADDLVPSRASPALPPRPMPRAAHPPAPPALPPEPALPEPALSRAALPDPAPAPAPPAPIARTPPAARVAPPRAAALRAAPAARPSRHLDCGDVLARQSLGDASVTSSSAARSCR